jgi:hypothetical protein
VDRPVDDKQGRRDGLLLLTPGLAGAGEPALGLALVLEAGCADDRHARDRNRLDVGRSG